VRSFAPHTHARAAARIIKKTKTRVIPIRDEGALEESTISSALMDSFSGGFSLMAGGSAVVIGSWSCGVTNPFY